MNLALVLPCKNDEYRKKKKILNSQWRPTFEVNIIVFYKVRGIYLNVILLQCWVELTVLLSHFNFTEISKLPQGEGHVRFTQYQILSVLKNSRAQLACMGAQKTWKSWFAWAVMGDAGDRCVLYAQEDLGNELFIFPSVCAQKHVFLFFPFGMWQPFILPSLSQCDDSQFAFCIPVFLSCDSIVSSTV